MNSNDVTVGAELEAEWPDGRWRPARILRRCGQEGDPGPTDCLFDILTGGSRGLRRASQLRPRRHWLLRLLRRGGRGPRKEAVGQPIRSCPPRGAIPALLRDAGELVRRAMHAAEPGDFPLEARLANLLRDIAQAEEAAAKKPEPRGRT
jgi:hypothetical protein